MPAPDLKYNPGVLPEGYLAVPVSAEQKKSALRVCLLVRRDPDPVAGHLLTIRDQLDAKVYMGCVVDAGMRVHQWVEVWVQTVEGLASGVPAARESLTNQALDERWERQVRAFDRFDRQVIVKTGMESPLAGPAPTLIDVQRVEPYHPVNKESGDRWALCRDDALLLRAGLPPYSSSLERYLYLPEAGVESVFAPVTPNAPMNEKTRPLAEAIAPKPGADAPRNLVPFNVGAGLMMVRAYSHVRFEAFVDMLGGGAWSGVWHGASQVEVDHTVRKPTSGIWTPAALGANQSGSIVNEGGLFVGRQGKWGRVIEALHLKLRAVADVLVAVRAFAQETQRPLLNLRPESLQVRLTDPAPGLPYLWTSRVCLADPGDAFALPIKTSDAVYYLPGTAGASIFRPDSAGRGASVKGKATLRIRQVLTQPGEETILEATFATDERVKAAKNDLVWLRMNIASGRLDLYGRLESQSALAAGEYRLRTLSQRLGGAAAQHVQAAQGVPIQDVAFEVIPLLSTPCDLYSLGVLAVRALLVNADRRLPEALDDVFSLAREAGAAKGEAESVLEQRIAALLASDKRWTESLGPQRLVSETMAPQEALDVVPLALWSETLAMIVRTFPGLSPDSACSDLGDARQGGVHLAFDKMATDLDALLRKTRSLIVIDWNYNREIHAVIRKHLMGLAGKNGGAAGKRVGV